MAYTVLLDANVLYSAPVRDLLVRLALTDLYRARWTADINQEWVRALSLARPDIPLTRLEQLRDLLNANVRDALVEGYESLIPALQLPDADDRHVLAAAIVGRADLIVTYNLEDFPALTLEPHGVEVQHPDAFLIHQFDLAPPLVLETVGALRRGLKRPAVTPSDYLATLERHRLHGFAARLRPHVDQP